MAEWAQVLALVGGSVIGMGILLVFLRWLGHEMGKWLYDEIHKK